MLMPTSLFDFMEEANDYYFPPLVGTYLRYLRIIVRALGVTDFGEGIVPLGLNHGFGNAFLAHSDRAYVNSEPSDGKVLRGSHDGFTETLVQNTALLRRRIRDSHLTLTIGA